MTSAPAARGASAPRAAPELLLAVSGLSKTFPGVTALKDVELDLHAGEVLALVGHNGSGKSTLVKVLAGIHRPDEGSRITVHGGLHFIHQDLGLVPMLSTVENLDLAAHTGWRGVGPTRRSERARAVALVGRLGGTFDVTVPIAALSPAERTIVAIARATASWTDERNVLVLDEPTAALHGAEVDRLQGVVRQLAATGTGVVYISHRLDEVVALADRAVVLRDGRVVAEFARGGFDHDTLVAAISGGADTAPAAAAPAPADPGPPRLSVRGLRTERLHGLDLDVRPGEVVGFSGLVGSGMEHVLGAVFGARPRSGGEVAVDGRAVPGGVPARAIAAGMGYVPADRRGQGAVLGLNARENLTLANLRPLRTLLGRIHRGRERRGADTALRAVGLRPHAPEREVALFSGGNQQKIVIAKWLQRAPTVLLFEEPTQGIDVGAQAGIYRLVQQAAAGGAAVLVASSDVKELLALCDRVLVLRDGHLAGELSGADLTENRLLRMTLSGSPRADRAPETGP